MKRVLGIAVLAVAVMLPTSQAFSTVLPYSAIACQTLTDPGDIPDPTPGDTIPPLCSSYQGKSCSSNGRQVTCNLSNGTQHKCVCVDLRWDCRVEDDDVPTPVEPAEPAEPNV